MWTVREQKELRQQRQLIEDFTARLIQMKYKVAPLVNVCFNFEEQKIEVVALDLFNTYIRLDVNCTCTSVEASITATLKKILEVA